MIWSDRRWMASKRRANPALSEKTNLLLRVAEGMPARAWIKDASGRYIFVNDEVLRVLELEREKFIGFTDEEIFPRVGHVYWRKDQIVLSTRQPLITTDQVEREPLSFLHKVPARYRRRTPCGYDRG